MIGFRCDACGSDFAQPPVMWRCRCGGPLSVTGRGRLDAARLSSRPPTLWRYREAIALDARAVPVSLGEGMTPLVRRDQGGLQAWFKLEMLNPTGSFKDRGASVVVSE